MEFEDSEQEKWAQKRRSAPRYAVPWKIVVAYTRDKRQEIHSAVIADISMGGASFFAEQNVHSSKPIAATIEIPAYLNRRQVIVGIQCRILYSVISSNYGKFRVVLKFLHFNRNGRRDLMEALSNRIPLDEYPSPF